MFYRHKFSDVRVLQDVNIKYLSLTKFQVQKMFCVSTFSRCVVPSYVLADVPWEGATQREKVEAQNIVYT